MRRLAPVALLACLPVLASTALAFDNGQFEHVAPDVRAWFKSVIAPNGVPCCDVSDGHRTEYDVRAGADAPILHRINFRAAHIFWACIRVRARA